MPGFGVNQCGNWILFHTLFISMIWSFDSRNSYYSYYFVCDRYTVSLQCSLPVSEFMQFQDWSQKTGLVWHLVLGHFHQEFRESDQVGFSSPFITHNYLNNFFLIILVCLTSVHNSRYRHYRDYVILIMYTTNQIQYTLPFKL
jgi:hypothetical protein